MCGLVGISSNKRGVVDETHLERMRDAIAHRGPDDLGMDVIREHGIGLAFARLSIIDRSVAGHQPMWNESKSVALVFNGEIYNYRELRAELKAGGATFRSKSDSEVILRGYERWSHGVLSKLTGMFGLAVVDFRGASAGKRPDVLLARDRMGEKPLYYWWEEASESLMFASEIKALLVHPRISREVSEAALNAYLALGYVPAPDTMFKDIFKLPAGHSLSFSSGPKPIIQPYWQPTAGLVSDDKAHLTRRVRELVEAAVLERLESEVPLGAFLSGGIDSTIIAGVMSRNTSQPVHTFAAAFEIGERSFKYNVDAVAAETASRKLGTKHKTLKISADQDLLCLLRRACFSSDEPIANPTLLTTKLLAQRVKQEGITVALTGDGSDELFGGYTRYQRERWVGWAEKVPTPARRLAVRAFEKSGRGAALADGLRKADLPGSDGSRYLSWWTVFSPEERARLLTRGGAASDSARLSVERILRPASNAVSGADLLALADLSLWIPDESNMRTDKMTMAHALETRAPFQDHSLVEFALSIPFNHKVGFPGFEYKRLLKHAFADLIPQEIMSRPKWGWFSPVHYWVNDWIWKDIVDLIGYLPSTGWFKPSVVNLVNNHPTAIPAKLWALAVFAIWHQIFIDEQPVEVG